MEKDKILIFFFFQAEDGIRDYKVTGVQTCALPICKYNSRPLGFFGERHHLILHVGCANIIVLLH